jgi:hypothetical protein
MLRARILSSLASARSQWVPARFNEGISTRFDRDAQIVEHGSCHRVLSEKPTSFLVELRSTEQGCVKAAQVAQQQLSNLRNGHIRDAMISHAGTACAALTKPLNAAARDQARLRRGNGRTRPYLSMREISVLRDIPSSLAARL